MIDQGAAENMINIGNTPFKLLNFSDFLNNRSTSYSNEPTKIITSPSTNNKIDNSRNVSDFKYLDKLPG